MAETEREKYRGLTARAWAGIALGVLALGGFFYVLTTLGPNSVNHPAVSQALNATQWKLSGQIEGIEQRYKDYSPDQPMPAGLKEDVAKAIVLQEQLLRINPETGSAQTDRLERLLMARDTLAALAVWPRIEALEKELPDAEGARRIEGLTELLKLRREINQGRASARYKDLARETQLERTLMTAQAEPLKAQVNEVWSQARAAVKEQNWMTALDDYTKARELMDEVNQRFARTRYSDIGFQTQLLAMETSLQGAYEAAEIDVLVKGAEEAARLGDRTQSADQYQQAAALQMKLNQKWPKSRFASDQRPELLETKRQTVLAEGLLEAAHQQDQTVNQLLAQRRTLAAVTAIQEIHTLFQRIERDYARSGLNDAGLAKKYAYLLTASNDLRALQDAIYRKLVPMPESENLMTTRSSVNQKSYEQLMRFNPSRERGEQRAVDSVTWGDAQEFCRRLGWVLGRQVRLPRASEVLLIDQIDGSDAAPESTQAKPLFSEWLDADEAATQAPIIRRGGADEVDPNSTDKDATSVLDKKTPSRNLSFRVVVEIPES